MIKRYVFRAVMAIIMVLLLTSGDYDFFQLFMIAFALLSLDVTVERHLLGGDEKE